MFNLHSQIDVYSNIHVLKPEITQAGSLRSRYWLRAEFEEFEEMAYEEFRTTLNCRARQTLRVYAKRRNLISHARIRAKGSKRTFFSPLFRSFGAVRVPKAALPRGI